MFLRICFSFLYAAAPRQSRRLRPPSHRRAPERCCALARRRRHASQSLLAADVQFSPLPVLLFSSFFVYFPPPFTRHATPRHARCYARAVSRVLFDSPLRDILTPPDAVFR